MRWIPAILLFLAAGGWLSWFALGLGTQPLADQLRARHIPDDAVITPYVRVDGSIHGDFIRRCAAQTTWYDIHWVEREDQDEKWKGFENITVWPRWDRVWEIAAIPAGLAAIWVVIILRRRKA